jgi:hypothetical protein
MNRNTDLIRLLWSRRFIAIATLLPTESQLLAGLKKELENEYLGGENNE